VKDVLYIGTDGVVSTVQLVAVMNIDLKLNLNLGLIHFRHLMRVSLINPSVL
jgi:hypothetical protein